MKLSVSLMLFMVLGLSAPATAAADGISADALSGRWLFTDLVMDQGGRKMAINQPVEFMADGAVVWYDAAGNAKNRGSFEISAGTINYSDEKGKQKWKVVSFDSDKMHVDHRGAQMYFERR